MTKPVPDQVHAHGRKRTGGCRSATVVVQANEEWTNPEDETNHGRHPEGGGEIETQKGPMSDPTDSGRRNAGTKRRQSDDQTPGSGGGAAPAHAQTGRAGIPPQELSVRGRSPPGRDTRRFALTGTYVVASPLPMPQKSEQIHHNRAARLRDKDPPHPPLPRHIKNSPCRARTASLFPVWLSICHRPAFTRAMSSAD